MAKYERILLKLSGEAMAGPQSFGIDPDRVKDLAAEVASIAQAGIPVSYTHLVISWTKDSSRRVEGARSDFMVSQKEA